MRFFLCSFPLCLFYIHIFTSVRPVNGKKWNIFYSVLTVAECSAEPIFLIQTLSLVPLQNNIRDRTRTAKCICLLTTPRINFHSLWNSTASQWVIVAGLAFGAIAIIPFDTGKTVPSSFNECVRRQQDFYADDRWYNETFCPLFIIFQLRIVIIVIPFYLRTITNCTSNRVLLTGKSY